MFELGNWRGVWTQKWLMMSDLRGRLHWFYMSDMWRPLSLRKAAYTIKSSGKPRAVFPYIASFYFLFYLTTLCRCVWEHASCCYRDVNFIFIPFWINVTTHLWGIRKRGNSFYCKYILIFCHWSGKNSVSGECVITLMFPLVANNRMCLLLAPL